MKPPHVRPGSKFTVLKAVELLVECEKAAVTNDPHLRNKAFRAVIVVLREELTRILSP